MKIVVTTPTGNIGSVVTEKLLAAGEQGGWTMVSMKDDWKTIFKG